MPSYDEKGGIDILTIFHDSMACYVVNSYQLMINSSPPRATYMSQCSGLALVQVMARHLFGAKPLPEPELAYN